MSEPNDPNLGEMADSIYTDLKYLADTYLSMGEMFHQAVNIASEARKYWRQVDPTAFQGNPIGGTAMDGLTSFRKQVSEYRKDTEALYLTAQEINSTTYAYGTLTATAFDYVQTVPNFDTAAIYEKIERPGRDDEYAAKLERFEPEVGKLYRQILQTQRRTTSYPEKSVLPDARQAFDCLLNKLVPNRGNVRSKSWWPGWYTHGKDPNEISTPQLIRYAAEKWVKSEMLRDTLINNSIHAYGVHKQLSELFHQTHPVDEAKARSASLAMLTVLNSWADALEL